MFYGLGEVVGPDAGAVDGDSLAQAGAGLGLSLILVPFAFMTAGLASAHPEWHVMTLAGMGLFIAVGLLLLAVPPTNPLASLVAGFAAGAVVTVSRPLGAGLRHRVIAAGVAIVLVFAGFLVAPFAIAWLAPALPFTAVGLADQLAGVQDDGDLAAG